jgi:hypothetical protein
MRRAPRPEKKAHAHHQRGPGMTCPMILRYPDFHCRIELAFRGSAVYLQGSCLDLWRNFGGQIDGNKSLYLVFGGVIFLSILDCFYSSYDNNILTIFKTAGQID